MFGPLAAFEPDNPELFFCYIHPKLVIFTRLIPKKACWFCRLLTLQTVLSKWLQTSGNTVKFQINHLPKTPWYLTFSTANSIKMKLIQISTLISFHLLPRLTNLVTIEVWSFIKRFTTASTNRASKSPKICRKSDRKWVQERKLLWSIFYS